MSASDSEEWASASDSEVQDSEELPTAVKHTIPADTLPSDHTIPADTLPSDHTIPADTLPSDHTMSADTLPSDHTMSADTLPSDHTIPADTLPSDHTISADTLPSDHTIPADTLPSDHAIPADTLPSDHAIPADTLPSDHTMSADTLPPDHTISVGSAMPADQKVTAGTLTPLHDQERGSLITKEDSRQQTNESADTITSQSNNSQTEILASTDTVSSVPPPYEEGNRELEGKEAIPIESNKPDKLGLAEAQREVPPSPTWGSWGSNWLSKAASSVAASAQSLAANTEIGLSTIVNSVESSFGIPTPESIASRESAEAPDGRSIAAVNLKELAQRLKEEQTSEAPSMTQGTVENDTLIPKESSSISDNTQEQQQVNREVTSSEDSSGFFSSYGITLTNKILSGGLGTLENIGKKTMDLLSEGDPGLRNKRAYVQEQIEILTKEKSGVDERGEPLLLTSFHSEFEKLQGYVYLEAMEILSSDCDAKQRLKMHSVSTKRSEEGAFPPLLEDKFEINFDRETASCEWGELFPSCSGIVGLSRVQQTVGELNQCSDTFNNIETDSGTLLPHLNTCMQLLAKLSSQYIQTIRKVSELCLAQQVSAKETLTHSRELALIAYRSVDSITTRIALIEVSDDVIGNRFILDMNSAITYIQDSFGLLRSVITDADSS